ncbi:hypothetical protein Tco_0852341, partial [Tanacetum coccineum]
FHMAQQVIPAAQLVPRFHTIRRCNNYAVLQSIPCSPECNNFRECACTGKDVDSRCIPDHRRSVPPLTLRSLRRCLLGYNVPMNQPQTLFYLRKTMVVEGEKDDDDSENRLEPESHKENPEYADDDDDEEKVDEEKDVDMGSLETRTKERQTPIPTPLRSYRINLSSDKNIT